MKHLLLASFIAIIVPAFVSGQEKLALPTVEGQLYYEFVDTTIKMPKAEIYDHARQWVTKSFKSVKYVLETEDQAAGKLVVKGLFAVYNKDGSDKREVNFTLNFIAQENGFSIIFKNIGAIQPAKTAAETNKEFDIMGQYAVYQKAEKPDPKLADLLTKIDLTFKGLNNSFKNDIHDTADF